MLYISEERQQFQSFIEREMYDSKKEALRKLSLVIHPDFVNEIAAILDFGLFEDMPEARRIAQALHLQEKEIIALSEDASNMEKYVTDAYESSVESYYEDYEGSYDL